MMKKIFTKSFMAVAFVAVVGFVSSCKDYNDEMMAEYRGEDAELAGLIDNLDGLLSDLTTKHNEDIQKAKEARDAMKAELDAIIKKIQEKDNFQSDSLKLAYDSAMWAVDSIGKLDARIVSLENRVKAIEDIKAGDRLKALEDIEAGQRLDSIEKALGALTDAVGDSVEIAEWASDIKDLQADVKNATGSYNNLTERLNSMQQSIDGIESCAVDCEALDSLVNEVMSPKVDSIANVTAELGETVEELNDELGALFRTVALDVIPKVKSLEAAVDLLKEQYSELDKKFTDSIAALRSDLIDLEARVKANEDAIDSLTTRVDELKDALNKRISSVLVQGAYSPVIGYFNMPLGIKSNILAAYKGGVIEDMNFPFAYIDGATNPLIALQSSLGYEGETISELGDGYAGKLYLTINPAEVELSEVGFALVNSANEEAPVALATPVETSDVLKFGYTRAGVAVYEAEATITDVNKASIDLNLSDYKDILSDLKNGNVNLADIAGTLYSTVNEVADANAVRASWEDSLGEHTVYSDFGVAAVAVKPLSFDFLADLDVDNIPGIDRVSNAIDNVIDRINFEIHIGTFDDVEFNLEHLDLDEESFNISIDTTIVVNGVDKTILSNDKNELYVLIDEDGDGVKDTVWLKVTEPVKVVVEDQNITFKYNKNMASEILKIENTVNGELTEVEHLIDQVNSMLAELRKTDKQINESIADAKENIKNELHKFLDKLNDKLCGAINSINSKLQPTMLVKTTGSFGVLSQSKNMPTVIENGAVLVPTTYTAELLAPAFKKYVAITAVDGSTAGLAAANTGDLNKVLDGNVRTVEFNGESGKTYELTYAALDYSGKVSTVKYYVTVK